MDANSELAIGQIRSNGLSPYAVGLRYCTRCESWFAETATTLIPAWDVNCQGVPVCPNCTKKLRSRPQKHTRKWRNKYLNHQEARVE